MKQSELKKAIKPLVKEIMLEVFAELHFDQIISESISKSMSKLNVVQENIQQNRANRVTEKDPKVEQRLLEKRRKMLDEMHVATSTPGAKPQPKNDLDKILAETEESGYQIYDEGNVNPELVSEDTVMDLVEGKDFSKFF